MDCGVGSIVWVRRRNGSWWPGQILGPDNLSASHLTSPRSGTPVKLLGREDASVDWYNLEKSKRVKAFRCGEFDDCIERVESSHGMPLKKREKYARREDAILHALELERQMSTNQGRVGIASDRLNCRLSTTVRKGVVSAPETLGNDREKHANLKPYMSLENEIVGGPFHSDIASNGNQLIEEVDHFEATHRVRGLQDLGLKMVPFKGKLSSPVDPKISKKRTLDDGAQALASDDHLYLGSAHHTNGAGPIGVPCRAKKSRCMHFPAESGDNLDYKETLNHVEISSSQFGGEFPFRSSFDEEMDDDESDSSDTSSTCSDSDSSETEPDMDDEMAVLSETGPDAEEHESISSEEPDELAVSSDMPHLYPRELITRNEAVSKWQLKGKRNNRNLVKRSVGAHEGKVILYGAEADAGRRRSHLSHRRMDSSLRSYRNDFSDALDDDDQIFGTEDDHFPSSRAVSKSQNKIQGLDWDDWAWGGHLTSKGYWDIKGFTPMYGDHYRFGGRMRSRVVDVDLKVQASYRKEPVPIVSLMSKFDGRAIIGHPIQVEAVKDGSSDTLFSSADDFNDGFGIEGNGVLAPSWRTARRTANFRVPRPHVLSSNSPEVGADFPFDKERNFEYKKSNTGGSSSHKANLRRKSGLNSPRSSTDKKSSKKVPKKVSLSSSQKTRTLSSLSIEHNHSRKSLHDSSSYQTNRLIKPEISGPTTVACIPVQLVYSRLLEKINRPPMKATSNAALLNTGVERNS